MGMCLPCLGGAAEDVVETPDPVSCASLWKFTLVEYGRVINKP